MIYYIILDYGNQRQNYLEAEGGHAFEKKPLSIQKVIKPPLT